jgi:hypothetical protein
MTARTGTTPFMVFASALSALIHSGSADRETILLGTLIAQRDRAEWRQVIGPLLNVSIVAIDLALRDTVLEALHRTRNGALRAYRSSCVPYQELAALLKPVFERDGSPFEVLLVMQPDIGERIDFDGVTADLVEIDAGAPPYPVIVDVDPRNGGFHVTHRLAPGLDDATEDDGLAVRLGAVVGSMVMNPGQPLAEILPR